MGNYEFVKGADGRLTGKTNYAWQLIHDCGNQETAEAIALLLEEKTGKACKGDMKVVWIQGDRKNEAIQAALREAIAEHQKQR